MRSLLFLISLLLLGSCAPSSLTDFQKEGEALSKQIAQDLREIDSREELIRAVPLLKKRLNALVDLMIAARKFQSEHPEECLPETEEYVASEDLLKELKRIYRIEGGREIIEAVEREPLFRLDEFERSLTRAKMKRKS